MQFRALLYHSADISAIEVTCSMRFNEYSQKLRLTQLLFAISALVVMNPDSRYEWKHFGNQVTKLLRISLPILVLNCAKNGLGQTKGVRWRSLLNRAKRAYSAWFDQNKNKTSAQKRHWIPVGQTERHRDTQKLQDIKSIINMLHIQSCNLSPNVLLFLCIIIEAKRINLCSSHVITKCRWQ